MRLNCKVWPLSSPHPAFPKEKVDWAWLVNVKLIYKHSPTAWLEAWIDSGSPWRLFHSSFCRALGIKLDSGIKQQLGGIITGPSADVYFHKVRIMAGSEISRRWPDSLLLWRLLESWDAAAF